MEILKQQKEQQQQLQTFRCLSSTTRRNAVHNVLDGLSEIKFRLPYAPPSVDLELTSSCNKTRQTTLMKSTEKKPQSFHT